MKDGRRPRRVWVTLYSNGQPSGVTRLKSEADEWRNDGERIYEYVLAPVQVKSDRIARQDSRCGGPWIADLRAPLRISEKVVDDAHGAAVGSLSQSRVRAGQAPVEVSPGTPKARFQMPFAPASTLEKTVRVKALLLGSPGVGKTTVALCSTPRPVGVILCEQDTAMDYARLALREDEGLSDKEIDKVLSYQRVDKWDAMMKAMQEARAAAEAGEIETLVIDPLNFFADRLMDQATEWTKTKDGNEDGRRAHPECTKRLRQLTYQLLGLPCHVVVVSHYMDVGDAAKRGGPDKVPMLPNKEARAIVHGMFPHKLWMQFNDKNERIFVTTPQGATGPGVRGYRGAAEIPADFGVLMDKLSIPGVQPKKASANGAGHGHGAPTKTNGTTAPATHVASGKPAAAKPITTQSKTSSSSSSQRPNTNNQTRR